MSYAPIPGPEQPDSTTDAEPRSTGSAARITPFPGSAAHSQEKPGVEGLKPGWFAIAIAAGIAMWAMIIAALRAVFKLLTGG